MTTATRVKRTCSMGRRGLSLVEAVLSVILVSVLLVASVNTVGASRAAQSATSNRSWGNILAQGLMSEILQQSYADPVSGEVKVFSFGPGADQLPVPVLGPEPGEADGTRSMFDDVDDYDGWSASPPQAKDGTVISGLDGWRRTASVTPVAPANLTQTAGDHGAKAVTVSVTHNNRTVAELVAIRTIGLPPPLDDVRVLFVVTDENSLTDQESARKDLLASWGYVVALIAASAPQESFDAAAADAEVAYVSEEVDATEVGTKLRAAIIGVVNEDPDLADEFGFTQIMGYGARDAVSVTENTHYITSPFALGLLTLFGSTQPVHWTNGPWAPDLQTLAETNSTGANYKASLATLVPGAVLWDGGTAAGRRVQLPWGADAFDFNSLNDDGETILKRALAWAADREDAGGPPVGCGDGTCGSGEDPCNCPDDCGTPPSSEEVGVTCADGLDNDCDEAADCDDINCAADATCGSPGPTCDNGVCEPGESCYTCLADCPGVLSGEPADQYCCGDAVLQPAEGDGSICDGNP